MYLQPKKFYYNSKKITQKLKKPHYLINSEYYQKSALNKKYLKLNFLSGMLYKILCIFNQYRSIRRTGILSFEAIYKKLRVMQLVSLDKMFSMTLRYFHTKGDLCIINWSETPIFVRYLLHYYTILETTWNLRYQDI